MRAYMQCLLHVHSLDKSIAMEKTTAVTHSQLWFMFILLLWNFSASGDLLYFESTLQEWASCSQGV